MPLQLWAMRKAISNPGDIFHVSLGRDPPARVKPMRVVLEEGTKVVTVKPRILNPECRTLLSAFVALLVFLNMLVWMPQAIWSNPAMPVPK
ncbi:unnamed protein product, partial [Discosporangium mesarthrocarpum]